MVRQVQFYVVSTICQQLSAEYSKNGLHGCSISFKEILKFTLTSSKFDKCLESSFEILISLYSDDLGITNPISKSRGKLKLWVLYFQLLNIVDYSLSKTFSIFPLSITVSKLVKDKSFIKPLLLDLVQLHFIKY